MERIKIIVNELFYVLTAALVIFCVMELAWERIVLSYININWVLILWLIDVMVLLGINNKKDND
jgi:cytochrome c oxidase subunit IV